MADDIITPGGVGGSEESKKVVGGWQAIVAARQQGKSAQQLRNERILKEQKEPKANDNNFRPGDEPSGEGFNARKAKEHMQKLLEQKQTQKVFKGNASQIALKLQLLTEGDPDVILGDKGAKGGNKVKVIGCEDVGMGMYKLTYLLTD